MIFEHLDILDALEEGDQASAAELMRRHLDGAAKLSPVFASAAAERKSYPALKSGTATRCRVAVAAHR
jgi:DNA-binding GntR family transcriptional regulator